MTDNPTVYIIYAIKELFNYDEESVCGVFTDGEEAKKIVEKKLQEIKEAINRHQEFGARYTEECPDYAKKILEQRIADLRLIGREAPPVWRAELDSWYAARTALLAEFGGTIPEQPEINDYRILEVPLNTWGDWEEEEKKEEEEED